MPFESYRAIKARKQIREEVCQTHYAECAAVGVPKSVLYVAVDRDKGKVCFNGRRMTLEEFTAETGAAGRAYKLVPCHA